MIFGKWSDMLLKPYAEKLIKDDAIVTHGGRRLMVWSKRYNNLRYSGKKKRHERAYTERWEELLRKNNGGQPPARRLEMKDGWLRDDSHSLPHLDRLLEQAGEIVDERGGRKHSDIQQPFLRSLLFPGDLAKYPAMLDFITSSEVLALAARHLGTVPVLSKTRPPGVRFMESNASLDPGVDGPYRTSQLHHLDLHDTSLVYVLVMARDIPPEAGPWTFLPQDASDRATRGMGYREKGAHYRVTDEQMAGVVSPSEQVVFSGKKGDVLFIDSSRCFHFGSRHSLVPRFQLMFGLTTPCRTDLSQTFLSPVQYPLAPTDSALRRMVLEP
ncbi:MAG TPA: hypothetical protein VK985_11130 [Rariglobus sp.]|nr:hypothetical protein [Rariglobus sp.]